VHGFIVWKILPRAGISRQIDDNFNSNLVNFLSPAVVVSVGSDTRSPKFSDVSLLGIVTLASIGIMSLDIRGITAPGAVVSGAEIEVFSSRALGFSICEMGLGAGISGRFILVSISCSGRSGQLSGAFGV